LSEIKCSEFPDSAFLKGVPTMNKILLALAVLLVLGGTASAHWYGPEVVTSYYGAPVLTAPAPYLAPAPVVYSSFYAPPVVVARPRVVYSPVIAPAPIAYAPAPVVVGRPVVVRSKVYYPGRPIYNSVRYVIP
jgi:hypothetical protein